MEEGELHDSVSLISGQDEGGEFLNKKKKANGCFYLYYTYEESNGKNTEYFKEQVLLIKP